MDDGARLPAPATWWRVGLKRRCRFATKPLPHPACDKSAVAPQDHLRRGVPMRRRDERGISRPSSSRALRGRADRPCGLLRLILRRVRQRALVILNPHVIPRIGSSRCMPCIENTSGLRHAPTIGAPSTVPRGLGSSSDMIAAILIPLSVGTALYFPWFCGKCLSGASRGTTGRSSQKNQAPEFLPRPVRRVPLSDVR